MPVDHIEAGDEIESLLRMKAFTLTVFETGDKSCRLMIAIAFR